ncbi:MAG: hypothetical protein PHX62_04085 [Bacilli bacterium]|nr:hypothetical protein [Bacilli bacterium]
MQVLFVILNKTDYLQDVLTKFADLGVKGATILDSQGMGNAIIQNEMNYVPLFGSLNSLLKEGSRYSKTIFTVIHDDELLEKTICELQKLLDKETRGSAGFMFTIEASNIFKLGSKKK